MRGRMCVRVGIPIRSRMQPQWKELVLAFALGLLLGLVLRLLLEFGLGLLLGFKDAPARAYVHIRVGVLRLGFGFVSERRLSGIRVRVRIGVRVNLRIGIRFRLRGSL